MIEPVSHRLMIKPFDITESDDTYRSAKAAGIVLSGEDKLRREQAAVDRGTVVAVGPTAFRDFGCEQSVQVNDEIVYAKYAGKEVEDPETKEKYTIINDEDVVAILRKGIKE